MRLIYLVNQRLPIEKAYGIQIAKMCEAFAGLGLDLELVFPRRGNPSKTKKNVFDYFEVKKNFKEVMLPSLDFYLPGKLDIIAVSLKSFLSAFQLFLYSVLKKSDIIYSRDELPLFFLSFFKKNLVFEAHKFSKKRGLFYRRFKKKKLKVITISQGLKNEFLKFGFKFEDVLVAPDAVDLEAFDIGISKESARKELNLPESKKLIGYVGQLRTMGMKKGIDDLISSLKFLPEEVSLVLVGGNKFDIDFYKKISENKNLNERILFIGRVKHSLIPFYLKAFDVLTMPFPFNQHYALYMSPLKLFEYMASHRPIVATNLSSIQEILNEKNSVLIEPENPKNLAEGIKFTLENESLVENLANQAFQDVKNYTWNKRTSKILDFILEPE